MLTIEKIDTKKKADVKRFIKFHFDLYQGCAQWVPPFLIDCELQLNKEKHPFYEHSDADFWIALRDGIPVGRIGALENKPFNKCHDKKDAEFYLFDSINDQEVANLLFEQVFNWAKARGLDNIVGPKGFSVFDGYGIQIEGTENRQMMNMMNFNYEYYPRLVENLGFEKEVDFVSCYLAKDTFVLPERVHAIAKRVEERGRLKVQRFTKKSELKDWADRIGKAYNNTFINNWEYYPLTPREIKFVLDGLLTYADPRLVKIMTHNDEVVGFVLGFPDVSAAMQRNKGKLLPFGIFDLMLEMKRTQWVSLNGAGILPEFQGVGGNALMYAEMENTIRQYQFVHAELTQVAETAVNMRSDLMNVGAKPYKNHRVYHKKL